MRVAVVGAGWAGCTAALELSARGHQVVLLEASRLVGGRARRLDLTHEDISLRVDNGQHILIGAYTETLRVMRGLGLRPEQLLMRLPLTLRFADGRGLSLPNARQLPAALAAAAGILGARGWTLGEKLTLLRWASGWRLRRFECAADLSVEDLCRGLPKVLVDELVGPLCVSALNTPVGRASGRVFLRVLHDALLSSSGGSDLLLPRCDLSTLLPQAAVQKLREQGQAVELGARVLTLQHQAFGWRVQMQFEGRQKTETADAVVLACPSGEASRLASALPQAHAWRQLALSLKHEAIATVYACSPQARLAQPMLALKSDSDTQAQFVFDRGQLGGPRGLLAFVVSASAGDRRALEHSVLAQAERQLGLSLQIVQTLIERRATFACTPGLLRPGTEVVAGQTRLLACGDYIEGPYPATLEGAVRSGLQAARSLR